MKVKCYWRDIDDNFWMSEPDRIKNPSHNEIYLYFGHIPTAADLARTFNNTAASSWGSILKGQAAGRVYATIIKTIKRFGFNTAAAQFGNKAKIEILADGTVCYSNHKPVKTRFVRGHHRRDKEQEYLLSL